MKMSKYSSYEYKPTKRDKVQGRVESRKKYWCNKCDAVKVGKGKCPNCGHKNRKR